MKKVYTYLNHGKSLLVFSNISKVILELHNDGVEFLDHKIKSDLKDNGYVTSDIISADGCNIEINMHEVK